MLNLRFASVEFHFLHSCITPLLLIYRYFISDCLFFTTALQLLHFFFYARPSLLSHYIVALLPLFLRCSTVFMVPKSSTDIKLQLKWLPNRRSSLSCQQLVDTLPLPYHYSIPMVLRSSINFTSLLFLRSMLLVTGLPFLLLYFNAIQLFEKLS